MTARAAAARGFTLIEVLLATVLLAAGLAIAFSTLGAATRTAHRGESLAQRSERIRAVEGFLRKRIAAARPLAFATDEDSLVPQRFVGSAERMRFVADLPDYLGRGGPHLHDLQVHRDGDEARIEVDFRIVLAGETIAPAEPRPPEQLVDGLGEVRFRYRALDPETGALGEWRDEWEAADRLPLLVEVSISDLDGREWPPLRIALPQAGGAGADGFMGGLR
ncbi:general secretion pathway protein GspJ [Lysobacter arseniciresistens ZS79]|uniref:General secretion pathway protein GspJ n=1 Tax=Lysobacter arseniciresistens ZS79 TaxID=913325 RepID=A0A0A0EXD4_9GAMM|nr:prepilin-type N-terminal cleavage/methylation domain-containing protein [Lysobacter arseniciresistens]KGM55184.1 general secretion pathway protein GspJ [Lysobacter arseniciresistens ZS79]